MLRTILGHDTAGPVLFLTNDFPPKVGGIQTFVRQLCDDLPPSRVVVYAPAHPEAEAHDGALPFSVIRDEATTLLPTPGLARRLQRVVGEHGCTSVVYGASVPLGVLAPTLRRFGVTRQVALTHGHEVWWAALPGTRQVLRHVSRQVDVMTYVSDYTGHRLERAVGSPNNLVRLSPRAGEEFHPGVDGTAVRRDLGIDPETLVVVCVARLVRRKGQDRLIRIWPDVMQGVPWRPPAAGRRRA